MTYDDAAWAQMDLSFEVADKILNGEEVEDTYYSDIQLVNADNVEEYATRYDEA